MKLKVLLKLQQDTRLRECALHIKNMQYLFIKPTFINLHW